MKRQYKMGLWLPFLFACTAVATAGTLEQEVEGTWAREVEFLGEIYKTVKVLKDGHETVSVYDADGKLFQQWTVDYEVSTVNGINHFVYRNGKDTFGKYKGGTFNVDEPGAYPFRIKDDKWYEATGIFAGSLENERTEVIVYTREKPSLIDEVKERSAQYDAALLNEDVEALKLIWDEDGRFIDHLGKEQNYDEMVAGMKGLQIEKGGSTDLSHRVVEGTVIETGTYIATGRSNGEPFTWKHKFCGVWTKKDGRWVVTLEQVTPITE